MTGQRTTQAGGGGGQPSVRDEDPGNKSDESDSKEEKRKKMRFSSPARSSSPGREVDDDVSSFHGKNEGEGEDGDENNKNEKNKICGEEEDEHSSGGGSHDDDDDGGAEYLLFSRETSFSYDLPMSLQRGNSLRQHGGQGGGEDERERRSDEEEDEKGHSDGQGSPGGGKSSEGSDYTKKGDEDYSSASSIEFHPVGVGQALRCTSMESTSSSSLSLSSSYSSSFSSLFSSSSILLNDLQEDEGDDEHQKNDSTLEKKPSLSPGEEQEEAGDGDGAKKTSESAHISTKGKDACEGVESEDPAQEKQDEEEGASESSSTPGPCVVKEREQEGALVTREGDDHERKQGDERSSREGGASVSTSPQSRGDSSRDDRLLMGRNDREGGKEETRLGRIKGRFPIVQRRDKIYEDVYDAIKAVTSVASHQPHSFFACPPYQVPCVPPFPRSSCCSSSSFQAIRSTSSPSSHQCFMSPTSEMSLLEKEKQRKRLLVERLLASSSSKRPVSRLKSDHEKHSLFRLILSACDGLRIGIIFTGGGGIEGRFVRCTYTRRHVVTPASAPSLVMKKAPSPRSSHSFFSSSSSRRPPSPQEKILDVCGGNEDRQSSPSPGAVRSSSSHASNNGDFSQGAWTKKSRGWDAKGVSRRDPIRQQPSQSQSQQHRHHHHHPQRLQDACERRQRGGVETSSSSQGGEGAATKLGRVNPLSFQGKKKKFRGSLLRYAPTGNTGGGGSGNATGKGGGGGVGGRRWCISGIILEDAIMYDKSEDLFFFASHINSQVYKHSNRHHHHRQHHQPYTRGALSSSSSSSGSSSSSPCLPVGERGPGAGGRSCFFLEKAEDDRQHPKLHHHSLHHHHRSSSSTSSSCTRDKGRDTKQHCHSNSSCTSSPSPSHNRMTGVSFGEKMCHDGNRLNVESGERRSSSLSSSCSQHQQQRDNVFIGQYRREKGRSFSLACINPKNITMIFSTSSISDFYNQNIKAGEGIDVRIKRRQGDFIKNKVFDKSRRLGGKKDDLQQA